MGARGAVERYSGLGERQACVNSRASCSQGEIGRVRKGGGGVDKPRIADIDDIAGCYLKVYDKVQRKDRADHAAEVSLTIHRFYGWDAIVERFWRPFLETLEK